MKKCLSCILFITIFTGMFSVSASAAEQTLPALIPPTHIALVSLNDSDSPTAHGFSYSVDPELLDFVDALNAAENEGTAADFLAPYGLSDLFYALQIDWALDDVKDKVSGWHYNAFWTYNDAFGGFGIDDDGNVRVSDWDNVEIGLLGGEMIHTIRIFGNVPDDTRWNGDAETKTPGIKAQLNAKQYTYQDETLRIDLKKHTFYVRARIVCVGLKTGEEQHQVLAASKWSHTVSSGKSTKAPEPVTQEDLTAPEICDLRLSGKVINGFPVAAYTLAVPDDLIMCATQVAALDGEIRLETQARVMGDDTWTDVAAADRDLRPGERACPLSPLSNSDRPAIRSDMPIELRCRYVCSQSGQEDMLSDWSEVISYGSLPEVATPDEPTASSTPDEPSSSNDVYVYSGIICAVIAAIGILFFVIRRRKKQNRPTDSKT